MSELAIVGIGNLFRGDDAIGIVAARKIQAVLPRVHVVESAGDLLDLLNCFREFRSVYVVDSVASDRARPGVVHEFDALRASLPGSGFLSSSHAFGVSQAIELARALGVLPPVLRIFGVVGHDFRIGQGLSPEVGEALDEVVHRMVVSIRKGYSA